MSIIYEEVVAEMYEETVGGAIKFQLNYDIIIIIKI